MARSGLRVITQHDFLRTRGDDYLREADPEDVPGSTPGPGSRGPANGWGDRATHPTAPLDPRQGMRSAAGRTTGRGCLIGTGERVGTAATALAGYSAARRTRAVRYARWLRASRPAWPAP